MEGRKSSQRLQWPQTVVTMEETDPDLLQVGLQLCILSFIFFLVEDFSSNDSEDGADQGGLR